MGVIKPTSFNLIVADGGTGQIIQMSAIYWQSQNTSFVFVGFRLASQEGSWWGRWQQQTLLNCFVYICASWYGDIYKLCINEY